MEYSKLIKTTHFDTYFMCLAYSVPKLWSSAIRKISDFLNKYDRFKVKKKKCKSDFFSRKIIDGNVFFKVILKESTLSAISILKLANFWNLWVFQNWSKLIFVTKSNILKKQNNFPKIGHLILFQKGLNPQIVENKEIHRNLYKNCSKNGFRTFWKQTLQLYWTSIIKGNNHRKRVSDDECIYMHLYGNLYVNK